MKKSILICFLTFTHFTFPQFDNKSIENLAVEFVNTLSPDLKNRTIFNLETSERTKFSFVPIERKGTSFKDFDKYQKKAALKLLRASLSKKGFNKSEKIRQLEKVLLKIEIPRLVFKGKEIIRDYLDYHFQH